MNYSQRSIAGKGRTNEDRVVTVQLSPDRLIAVMADGMGGLDNGDLASDIAVNEIVSFFHAAKDDTPVNDLFKGALQKADNAIARESSRLGVKMGCAIAIVLVDKDFLSCVSLGNIRIWYNDQLLTEDDVYVDSLGGTYLTNCLRGRGIKTQIPIIHQTLSAGWNVCICSDGFYNNDATDDASIINITE